MKHWIVAVSFVAAVLGAASAQTAPHWVGTWACAPESAAHGKGVDWPLNPEDHDVTMRDLVHVSLGGSVIRLRLSNELGNKPVTFGAVHVAMSAGDGNAVAGTDHAATFGGAESVTVAAGKAVWTDAIKMSVPGFSTLAVSVFVPQLKGAQVVYHLKALSTNYEAAGNQAAAPQLTQPAKTMSWMWLTGVDVDAPKDAGAVVGIGGSLTDGNGSTPNANRRWTDDLAKRLAGNAKTKDVAVLNAASAATSCWPSARAKACCTGWTAMCWARAA